MGCGASSNPEWDEYPGVREQPETGHAYEDVNGAEAFFGAPGEANGGAGKTNRGRARKERAAAEADSIPKSPYVTGLRPSRADSDMGASTSPHSSTQPAAALKRAAAAPPMPGKAAHHKLGDDPAGIKPTCRASERDPTSVGAAAAAAGVDEVAAAKARAAEAIAKQAAKRTAEADKEKAAAAAAAYRQFQAQAQAGVGPTSSYGAAPNSAAAAAAAAVGAVPAETFVAADEEGAAREDMRRKVLSDLKAKMMGLEKDPRVVLQVLGVKVEGHPPTNEQLAAGYKRALVQCHPDRLKAKGGDEGGNAHTELYRELMAEETFKLVTYHRDILKAQMGGA